MTSEMLHTWTRRELQEAIADDGPIERPAIRLLVSRQVLLALMDLMGQGGDRVELLTAFGDPSQAEIRVYRR